MTAMVTSRLIPVPANVPHAVRAAMDLPMEDMRISEFTKVARPIFGGMRFAAEMVLKDCGTDIRNGTGIGTTAKCFARNAVKPVLEIAA